MKKALNPLRLFICLMFILSLLSACTQGGGEVTTEGTAGPSVDATEQTTETATPETTLPPDETTAPESTETESTTEAVTPETTVTPEIYEAYAYFYLPDGNVEKVTVKPDTVLPSAVFESVELPTDGNGVKVEHKGWEYSFTESGERKAYDLAAPPAVPLEGMHIYPVLEYSYLITFGAGAGAFPEGTVTEFYVKAGDNVDPAVMLAKTPVREGSGDTVYTFLGYSLDGEKVAAFPIKASSPLTFTSLYSESTLEYTLLIHTEHGDLIGGGKTDYRKGSRAEIETIVARYESYRPDNVPHGDELYRFKGLLISREGREWTLELVWEHVSLRHTVTLDRADGNPPESIAAIVGDKLTLPAEEDREDEIRYYRFAGWRDSNGQLYNGGYELTVTEDATFTAEFVHGERKIYTVIFDTEIGLFENGAPAVILTGYYGDPLTPPLPPAESELTFGEVVYRFAGWGAEVPATFCANAEYTAVYTTDQQVYYLDYYINGELYLRIPHFEGTALEPLARPDSTLGKIFSGWQNLPETMPAEDVRLDATLKDAEVIYMLDGEIIHRSSAAVGSLVTIASPAVKQGHTVSGWTTTDIAITDGSSFIMPEADVCFNAVSTPNTYTVTYIIDGNVIYTDSVIFGEIYTVRGIEVRAGYEFSGWQSDSVVLEESGIIVISDKDIVFVASFKPITYSVNYYIDGELVYKEDYSYGDTVILRPDEVLEGCTFKWSSAGADISSGSFEMPACDVDIYGAFSAGDNKIVFIVDGVTYGEIGVSAGQLVDLSLYPTKMGYTFTGWSCDALDVSEGTFIMPEGDIILRGSFVPNAHDVIFFDMSTGEVISVSNLDYGSSFSLGDRVYCTEGKVSTGWVLLSGDVIRDGDEYIMPDSEVVFGIVWETCLTLEIEEDYWVPYYDHLEYECEKCRFDESTGTLYISDPSVRTAGESEGITVVYEYENNGADPVGSVIII